MSNCSLVDNFTIAQDQLNQYIQEQADSIAPEPDTLLGWETHPEQVSSPKPVHVPQRKAKYSDRTRVRRRDVQGWVFHRTGAQNTQEIKAALKKLGRKLDLRLSAAWLEINFNLVDAIAQIIKSERAKALVGKKMGLREYSARLAYLEAWAPFQVLAVDGEMAKLELLSFPVAIADLVA